jgi:hypothetical protein
MAASMTMGTLKKILLALPANISVLVRGNHGIGKSQIMRWACQQLILRDGVHRHFFDRRMSQLSEGDVIGLPSLENGSTRFNPTDWFMTASREPSFVFLDELNRASTEVMQACFQIVLDRELNGVKLHPDTRVVAAVNMSSQYTVNEIDPALLDRFWVVNLEPTQEDWVDWARDTSDCGGSIDPLIIDFHVKTMKWLDPPGSADPTEKHPSRRTWEKLDKTLKHAGISNEPNNPLFFPLCQGFLGSEGALAFHHFAMTYDKLVSGDEIWNKFNEKTVKTKVKALGQEDMNALVDRVVNFAVQNLKDGMTPAQSKNFTAFCEAMYDHDHSTRELFVSLYTSLQDQSKGCTTALVAAVHRAAAPLLLKTFSVGKSRQNGADPANATPEAKAKAAPVQKKK